MGETWSRIYNDGHTRAGVPPRVTLCSHETWHNVPAAISVMDTTPSRDDKYIRRGAKTVYYCPLSSFPSQPRSKMKVRPAQRCHIQHIVSAKEQISPWARAQPAFLCRWTVNIYGLHMCPLLLLHFHSIFRHCHRRAHAPFVKHFLLGVLLFSEKQKDHYSPMRRQCSHVAGWQMLTLKQKLFFNLPTLNVPERLPDITAKS